MADPGITYLTVQDVARMTHRSSESIYQLRHRGVGPKGYRVGRRLLFREEDVHEWIDSLREPGAAG